MTARNANRATPLTVWAGPQMFTFPAGRIVTVGRADDADVRVSSTHKQALSRHHLVLHHDGTQWLASDKSRNGIFVDGRRLKTIAINDDTAITLGGADGPTLTFRVSTQGVPAARGMSPARPPSSSNHSPSSLHRPAMPPNTPPPAARAAAPQHLPRRPQPGPPMPPVPPAGPPQPRSAALLDRPVPPQPTGLTGAVKRMTARSATPPPGAISIGRSSSATVVVDDPLVSRVHAIADYGPTGLAIRDNASSNGTFVNGIPLGAPALLRPGDVITVGNADLVFDGNNIRPHATPTDARGITAQALALSVDSHQLLTDISFTARPGSLTAVIGPSGAGKSTLIKLLGGQSNPTEGVVVFDGHDLHADYASLRSRIGLVPQDDVVHRSLTVSQALRYAAELRLPPDTSRADRHELVDRVLAELELTEHRNKRVDTLSGGQRKRASVAMELLTGPSLLILDEPTSGLDPALDRQVMTMLRKLADAGRVVIVVTHSLTHLNLCDQVLLLAPGGKTAYAGPPRQVAPTLGTDDWADIFGWVSSDPDGAHRAYRARTAPPPRVAATATPDSPTGKPARTSALRQVFTVVRRQLRLLFADRGYFAFLMLLPFLLGGLALVVPGDVGLGKATAAGGSPNEPNQLLILLNIAAVFMGTALTIRDLVGERIIFRREQSVGLSAGAYLGAKVVVYSVIAALQAAVLTAIVVYGKGGPASPGVLIGDADLELYVTLAVTAIVSAVVGLMLSSLARTGEQILPMLVATVFLSIVFSGGMIPITGRVVLEQLSWFLPARWGFAASAATVDLMSVAPMLSVDDPLWRHARNWWALDVSMLITLGVAALIVVAARLRLPRTGATSRSSSSGPARRARVAVPIAALLLITAAVAGLTALTNEGGSKTPSVPGLADGPSQGPAPSQDPVAPEKLAGLLLDPATLGSAINAPQLASVTPTTATQLSGAVASPAPCTSTVEPGTAEGYRGRTVTGVAGQSLADPADARNTVVQFVVGFPTAEEAARYQDSQMTAWRNCSSTTVTLPAAPGAPPQSYAVDAVDSARGRLSVVVTTEARACQRVLSTVSNVVVDVRTCAAMRGQQAEDVASQIEDRVS